MIESQFFIGYELWQVKSERSNIDDQILNTFFKGDANARLTKLDTAYEEFHAEQGLAAAGTATDQCGPSLRQATAGNLVQSFDTRRGLGECPRKLLSLVH